MLSDDLFLMPSVRQFIETVQEDLADGFSVVVMMQHGVPKDITPAYIASRVQEQLRHREMRYHPVSTRPTEDIVSHLAKAVNVTWETERTSQTLRNLMRARNVPRILYLNGLERCQPEEVPNWLSMLPRWGTYADELLDEGVDAPSLLAILPPSYAPYVPEGDGRLRVHWWWGFPSALEMQLLCRMRNTTGSDPWQNTLLPPLVGSDVRLLKHLYHRLREITDLTSVLAAYAKDQGWSAEQLSALDVTARVQNANITPLNRAPAKDLRDLWALGLVCWTPEYQLEAHSAALALLGNKSEISHRIWRGQAQLLLPQIDYLRLHVCSLLTAEFGDDWTYRWQKPLTEEEMDALSETPYAIQLGHLSVLLRYRDELKAFSEWWSVVEQARRLRNKIAHYQTITANEYQALQRDMKRLNVH